MFTEFNIFDCCIELIQMWFHFWRFYLFWIGILVYKDEAFLFLICGGGALWNLAAIMIDKSVVSNKKQVHFAGKPRSTRPKIVAKLIHWRFTWPSAKACRKVMGEHQDSNPLPPYHTPGWGTTTPEKPIHTLWNLFAWYRIQKADFERTFRDNEIVPVESKHIVGQRTGRRICWILLRGEMSIPKEITATQSFDFWAHFSGQWNRSGGI